MEQGFSKNSCSIWACRRRSQEKTAEADEKKLREHLTKMFTFERMNDMADGGYPIKLHYKTDCPKYRALCPLAAQDAKILASIELPGAALPEPCKRYLGLSNLR